MSAAAPAASCLNSEQGCVMFDCLSQFWDWLDPPVPESQFQMENKKTVAATQQPISQQHLMAHHVHPEQIYSQQPTMQTHLPSQPTAPQPQHNGNLHISNQYQSNTTARSPLLENRHELYGTQHTEYTRHYGANDNYNYPQSPPQRLERTDLYTDHNVNHELLHIPKGYNAEVYQDYLKRNPPKETNQIYQNHQPTYKANLNQNQYGSKPYLPFSNRIGPQSNTELLRRQYNEIQQMKLQQQMHYQNQAQMQQQQKFAERQLLLQQLHGVQPPPNLQNSIYSDGSYRDLDQYSSKNDFKEYSSTDIQKDIDRYVKNNEFKDTEKQTRQYQDSQWQSNQQSERLRKQSEGEKNKSQSPEYCQSPTKSNIGVVSPMKSSDSSSPSIKSPSSEGRRSSGGGQALRSPIAQRSPSAPVTLAGTLYKQGSDGLKVWRKRWFVLSEYCLFYYKSQDEEKLLGSVLLPSYKVSACTADDKVLRKFAFKLEHANMRTYILAAPDQESMLKWVKALTMAALMQNLNEHQQRQTEQSSAKPEDGDEIPGPTYANAPPKPRRSNEGYNSPSPDMYDPNYDLLKKPASHYSQGTSHMRYQDTTYPASPPQETTYTRSPQSPNPQLNYQTKRSYDTHHLSLPLTNTVSDRLENKQTPNMYRSNPQSPYFDNRNRAQQPQQNEAKQDQIYERQVKQDPTYDRQVKQDQAYEQQIKQDQIYDRQVKQDQIYDRQVKQDQIYDRQVKQDQAYERQVKQDQAYERQVKQDQAYERQVKQDQAYERQVKQDQVYDRQVKQDQPYEQQIKQDQIYDRHVKQDQIYDRKVKQDQAYERQVKQDQVYERQIKQDQAYERQVKQDQAYERQIKQEQAYERQTKQDKINERQSRNPFLQDLTPQETPNENETQNYHSNLEQDISKALYHGENYLEQRNKTADVNYNRDVYGELNARPNKGSMNDRLLIERRTPDAYGRSPSMTGSQYNNKGKIGDYEDVYGAYGTENEYGKTYPQSPPQNRDATSISSQHLPQDYTGNYTQEKTFSGPSVLRRKKMQSSGIQPPMPRPHSADFLEYEAKNEMLNRTIPPRSTIEPGRQPQRPKSSLDINSYYDPSSDRYYSEESYAEKMRQSAQYLQHGIGSRNIQIPLAKYASGLAEKQLNSLYSQNPNHNYDADFGINRSNRDPQNYSKYGENINCNWTLKEKENQKDYRSGSVMSDNSNAANFAKDLSRYDPSSENFMRSASARLPSSTVEKDGEKKVQQREESMKRLLEWKQRMLQSPLTRKSTPATISLARSLNQSRQSLRSDQYKPKTYTNASYNSYSSDDEEETSGTDLQKPRDMQAGRSNRNNLTSPIVMRPVTPHAPTTSPSQEQSVTIDAITQLEQTENTYENILCTINMPKLNLHPAVDEIVTYEEKDKTDGSQQPKQDSDQDGYETHESEAESETQLEYTDNDLDEVLMESDSETQNKTDNYNLNVDKRPEENPNCDKENSEEKSETPPARVPGEGHYLPMSPRKVSTVEPAHKTILQNLSVFDQTMPIGYEDNPYVEMNVGNEEEDMQTYEIVCVNNGKIEPVYMELSNVAPKDNVTEESSKVMQDTASNFADTKDHTLKRASKTDRVSKEKFDCSDADDEASKDISLDTPFNRFSISDNFRPASYYLSASRNAVDLQDSSDSEILPPPPIPRSTPPCEDLSDEALSKYILDKLDKSDMSQDNSILKMLTSENQKMNTVKRKTTSLMIYGSRTSIHDTLSRGEKIRNSRASLTNERKLNETPSNLFSSSIFEQYNSSSIESDSVRSYNADRGSSRLSLESDISSKFDVAPSNISSEVASLNGSEATIDLRYSGSFRDLEMMIKRRPLSDDSIFELEASDTNGHNDVPTNADLDKYLDNLQPSTSECQTGRRNSQQNTLTNDTSAHKDVNTIRAAHLHSISHTRCSSTPVSHANKQNNPETSLVYRNIGEQMASCIGSHGSSSSVGITKSPISYYCKNFDEEEALSKNLNNDILADKIKEFEREKLALKTENDTNASSTTTGFHSRESSTEHSAPYYYSDLSSQEHINLLPTSHYLKNTNLHRKLNNQRRRGPLHKKNEISHIHNPIRSNQLPTSDRSFELAASARSVSVEFLSAADKDPDIDLKNIYESTGSRNSKIPESMNLISGLGCKRNTSNNSNNENRSPDAGFALRDSLNASSPIKVSNASMSSHCSENSSNTVYYDAEAEACAYENIMSQGEKHWDEDALWRDNLRRVSHRHARSMDDLDSVPVESSTSGRASLDVSGMNSIKRVKRTPPNKLSRNVTYVNCDIQNQVLRRRENTSINSCPEEEEEKDDNDVYVSLAENVKTVEQSDEGVYEQLAVESSENSLTMSSLESNRLSGEGRRRKFEIDREKLRQWDLMSSGLMKGARVRSAGTVAGGSAMVKGESLGSTDTGTDNTSNQASTSMSGANLDLSVNNSSCQQALSKKSFLGSNTSIGRNTRDANIPVRAVSPRVRWVEEKPHSDHYGSQQMSTSQQNLHILGGKDSWSSVRSPSRASQPIRAVSPRVQRNENDDMQREGNRGQIGEIPTAGELLGRTHEELVLLLIQLRRRHAATHRAIEQCCAQIRSIEANHVIQLLPENTSRISCREYQANTVQRIPGEDCLSSLKAMEREESLQRLEQLKMQLMELEHQYEKSKPLVQLVDNMVKLGSLYNRPGSTVERLERNQRLRQKVLAEHALEQQRWLESAAAGKPLETEAARARVAELWALEQELADEAAILQGLKTDKDAIESLLTGVRGKLDSVPRGSISDLSLGLGVERHGLNGHDLGSPGYPGSGLSLEQNHLGSSLASGTGLEAELARVHAMLAHNSKKLEQTVADNARLERELQQLRRALQARRASATHHNMHPTALLEDEVTRVQQLVSALQRQRQELSRAVRHLTQQSHVLQSTQDSLPGKRRPTSSWQETNLDTGSTVDHGHHDYSAYDVGQGAPPTHYPNVEQPLYVDTRVTSSDVTSPINSEDLQHSGFANLSNVEKQEIKTVRIVKRESERRQRDRERSLQPMSDWSANLTANLDQFLDEELVQPNHYSRSTSLPRTDFSSSKYEEYYTKPSAPEPPNYLRLNENMKNMELSPKYPTNLRINDNMKNLEISPKYPSNLRLNENLKNMELSPKYPSSPSLSNYDYSRDISSLSSSYNRSYNEKSSYDRTMSLSTQYLNSPTDSSKTLTNDPLSKTSSVASLTRSHMELSPIFKSEAAKQIITEISTDGPKTGSLHRRQVPKEKRRHYTAPHHLSAKTLNEMPKNGFSQDQKMGRSLDDADMERALRAAPAPDVVRSAVPTRYADSIDQLLAAPQKIRIPERYIPEKPPELSPEEQQKRQEKVESIKKMLSGSSADPSKSPDGEEKRQREHLLQMNQILAKQVTEMSKIIAVKALEELPQQNGGDEFDDRSPDVELPIYQQRDNFFT